MGKAIFLLWLVPGLAQALHPLATEDTGTQGAGRYELELGAEATRHGAGEAQAELAWGARDDVDLSVSLARRRAALSLKWRFAESGDASFALRPVLILPTGREAGSARSTAGAFFIASWSREAHSVHAHLGHTRARNTPGERVHRTELALAYVLDSGARWKLAAETWREANPARRAPALRYAAAAVVYAAGPAFDLDFGLRRGLNAPAAERALLAGATFRF
jgi:hypothetical protein